MIGASGFWSVTRLLTDQVSGDPSSAQTTVLSAEGELSRSEALRGVLRVEDSGEFRLSGSGTITWRDPADLIAVESGNTILELDLHPVVAIEGQVPMFRDLAQGDSGPDVRQLQEFLRIRGFFEGELDGRFGLATTSAVKLWQRELGQSRPQGTVSAGSVVALGDLPADFRYPEPVDVGAAFVAGDVLVVGRGHDGEMFVEVPESRLGDFGLGTRASISAADAGQVEAVVSRLGTSDGEIGVVLEPARGRFCDVLQCASLTPSVPLTVTVDFEIIPAITGVIIPASALRTQPDETLAVLLDTGELVPVMKKASDRGLVIVDGIAAGHRVVIG
ncbi:MAG: peptidoglycan-binding protein [Actinomycetia bacterium]|nr:peptidoglycan-binding protein [Actinomycetes bacterium]